MSFRNRLSLAPLVALMLAAIFMTGTAFGATLNEIRIDQGGADNDEYVELAGSPGESLSGLWLVTIGDGAGVHGTIETALDLSAYSIQPDGIFMVAEDTWTGTCGSADALVSGASNELNFENSDNLTFLLVTNFTGASGDDVDTNDDGVIDNVLWTAIVDDVALVETTDVPASGDYYYSSTVVGPDGTFVPGHAAFTGGAWSIGSFTLCESTETPGDPNGGPILQAPDVSNVLYRPILPTPAEDVDVNADATDSDGTVTGVEIIWTVDTVAQTPIPMSSVGGDSYAGTIPGQADGAVVEFFVQATDNDAQTGDGITLTYTVAPETITPIADIHADSLGFAGTRVMIQAQVYIPGDYQADGTSVSAYVQDATGGMNIFGTTFSTGMADLNDVTNIVKVSGTVAWYFDTLELVNYEVELVSTGNSVLTPAALTTGAAADFSQIGNYITATGPITAIFTTAGSNPAHNFTINDGSGDVVIRIDDDIIAGMDTWLVGDELVAAGAGSQFQSDGQIIVGLLSDITNNGQGPDLTPPTLDTAVLTGSTEVTLGFSEDIDAVTGNNTANYEVYETAAPGNTIAVTAAAVQADASQVVLTLAASASGTDHTVRVNNVEDLNGNPIAANTTLPIFEPGEVIIYINEIMQNPNELFDSEGEWFEIWNAGSDPVDIEGWTIADLDTDSHVIANGGPLVVPAGGYMVLGIDAAAMAGYGVTIDYQYSGITLSNSVDELILYDTIGTEINFVAWDNGVTWPDPTGKSMQWLGTGFNFDGTQWTENGFPFGNGWDWGSPGEANPGLSSVPVPVFETGLAANHPNPFNPKTAFNFTLGKSDHVRLDVFDVRGHLVATVVDEELTAGAYHGVYFWDGTDRSGRRVNSGTYFFRMKTGSGHVESRKMMLLK